MLAIIAASSAAIAGPIGLGGNVLWLDASDASTITTSGSSVSGWNDKSLAGNNFTATGGQMPTIGSISLNTLSTISFNGNNYMTGSAPLAANNDAYTYYAVWQPNVNGVQAVYEQGQGNNGRSSILAVNSAYGFNGQNNDRHDLVPFGPNDWRVTDMVVDNSLPDGTNNVYLTDNNVPYAGRTGNPGNLNIDDTGAIIGAKLSNNAERLNGNIAELLVYNRALSDTERADVRTYLDSKYALNGFAPPPPPTIDWDFEDDARPRHSVAGRLDHCWPEQWCNTNVPYLQVDESEVESNADRTGTYDRMGH